MRHDLVLVASVTALPEALAAVKSQIARLDGPLKKMARRSQVCRRLMSVPGVGPATVPARRNRGGTGFFSMTYLNACAPVGLMICVVSERKLTMKIFWSAALLLGVIVAAGPFTPSLLDGQLTVQASRAWAQSREARCAESRRQCIAAHARTINEFGVRGVSPEASRRCWAAYRQCIGRS